MTKIFGIIFGTFIVLVFFLGPIREGIDNLLHKEPTEQSDEEKVIGTVAIYNPRIKEIQKALKSLDLYPGTVDGRMGINTRAAIMDFQRDNNLKANGKVDSSTWTALMKASEMKPVPAATPATTSQAKVQTTAPETSTPIPVVEVKTPLPKSPAPISVASSKPKKAPSPKPASILSPRLKLRDSIKQIQLALQKSGFYQGAIDGKAGQLTRQAVIAFQKSKGLKPDGLVGTKTWQELSKYLQ